MVLEKRDDGSVWGYVARSGRDSYQSMHSAEGLRARGNCDTKLLHRDKSVPVSHLDCAAVSLLFFGLFFSFLLLSFFFPFFDLPHHGIGMGQPRGGWATGVRTRWQMDEQRR
jgi:hypothetical protein